MISPKILRCGLTCLWLATSIGHGGNATRPTKGPIKVFVLAGDETVLENGCIAKKGKTGELLPGSLERVVANHPAYGFLKGEDGRWTERQDVLVYDAHPIQNNTRAPGRPLKIGLMGGGGPERAPMIGPDLMLGCRLGNAIDEPVLILRYATQHPIWFRRGSRDLGHDYRPPSSGGGVDHGGNWDVIHFNFGIHDTAYRNPKNYKDKDEKRYPVCVPIDRYEANLRKMVAKLKKTGATLVWATITPLHKDTPGWKQGDEDRYNAVASKIMRENGVIIEDLNAVSRAQGYPKRPDVHSVGNLAPKVTETILAAIASREQITRPLPRVLMIGDSITGTYWEDVKKNLDGKAYVCKNPANAGSSDFGLSSIDAWLDLKSYLLNGESYLGLVSAIRDAMKNPGTVYPGYAGQGMELGGLVWFQGVADGQSGSKAAGYEKNLVNLIHDLRKDLKTPDLPVVVGAIAYCKGMTPNGQKVFDAQMAVGDGRTYPQFAGNVLSVDTRPFCHPNQSPGGRDPFAGSAESYLQIGEAFGRALLELMDKK